jgi:hypothetical protein
MCVEFWLKSDKRKDIVLEDIDDSFCAYLDSIIDNSINFQGKKYIPKEH